MTGNKNLFCELSVAGNELVGLHLMESESLDDVGRYPGFNVVGSDEVGSGYPKFEIESVCYGKKGTGRTCLRQNAASPPFSCETEAGRVYINDEQYFGGVRRDVWEFCVGGYQVCQKWLKDRRGRVLSYNDIEHYQKIAVAFGDTIESMERIDDIINANGGWPIG